MDKRVDDAIDHADMIGTVFQLILHVDEVGGCRVEAESERPGNLHVHFRVGFEKLKGFARDKTGSIAHRTHRRGRFDIQHEGNLPKNAAQRFDKSDASVALHHLDLSAPQKEQFLDASVLPDDFFAGRVFPDGEFR